MPAAAYRKKINVLLIHIVAAIFQAISPCIIVINANHMCEQ